MLSLKQMNEATWVAQIRISGVSGEDACLLQPWPG